MPRRVFRRFFLGLLLTAVVRLCAQPGDKKAGKKAEEELTAEDRALKEGLTLAVSRVLDENASLRKAALQILNHEIRTSTSSMTSVSCQRGVR